MPQQKSNRNQHSCFLPIMCMRYMQLKPFLSCLAAPKLSSKQTSKCVGPCQFICTSLNFFIVHHFIKLIFPGGGGFLNSIITEKKMTHPFLLFSSLKKITNLKTWRIDMCWHLEYSQTTLTPIYKTVSITGLITLVSDLYWASQINAHNKKKKNSHT